MYRELPSKLLTSSQRVGFTEDKPSASAQYMCANMIEKMAKTRIPCTQFIDPGDVVVSKRFLTFFLSENDRRYLFL